MTSRIMRLSGPTALVISLFALVFSMAGVSPGKGKHSSRGGKVVRTSKNGKIPVGVIPKVRKAVDADSVGGIKVDDITPSCAPDQVDLGSWCLQNTTYAPQPDEAGKTTYFWAAQKCVDEGGYLPTAAQLIGAANRVKLSSTIDDNQTTALVDIDPTDGSKDLREMSSTLVTTTAGSSSAGSEGVTDGSTGDPKQGQPNPVPRPANPSPDTLQYVTVYDNHENGGFAGSEPVSQPERFRCAFNKQPGAANQESGSGSTGSSGGGGGQTTTAPSGGSTEPKGGGGTTVK
jgi:hypothetical protein